MFKNILLKIFKKIFSNHNDYILHNINKIVKKINLIEPLISKLSDSQLSVKTIEFRNRIKKGETINSLLPEAFAVVREASKRIYGMRHFDVQLIGGVVLNNRCIAEMRTGEGKTLTSTLPAYLNALTGKGVHIVTVNEYLAKRDAINNSSLFNFLGISVGVTLPGLSLSDKQSAYFSDITYGTNNEFVFDYLRDNTIYEVKHRVQRELNYALIDEVDSILIDEARTPLIFSSATKDVSNIYRCINKIIPNLIFQDKEDSDIFHGKGHFTIDKQNRQINITEFGFIFIEKLLIKHKLIKPETSLYDANNIILISHVITALKAHMLYFRNIDYIIKNKHIIIVDEHTGRIVPERRWSDGLHQALEAKENLNIQKENKIISSITFQNYFRLYKKLAGMTGTANTEAFEFRSIYQLDTIIIPTNKPMIRKDLSDLVYLTEKEKINAIIKDVKTRIKKNQPVLIGSISIEKSEIISKALNNACIPHKILNAKYHEMEANIIAQAGYPGAVTIATNMAGRGTDIILGGSLKQNIINKKNISNTTKIKKEWQKLHDIVVSAGGLHIIGTERHESRRIDNQLCGRSGRQGDPGSSRFYLSLEDNLIRIFASKRITFILRKLGVKYGEAIEHTLVTSAIYHAQRKVESRNFDIRKQILEYDDITNEQRNIIHAKRNKILNLTNIEQIIQEIHKSILKNFINNYIIQEKLEETWDLEGLKDEIKIYFNINIDINNIKKILYSSENKSKNILYTILFKKIVDINIIRKKKTYDNKIYDVKKNILYILDSLWKKHLELIEYLRQGIHLYSYAQRNPKYEYKYKSFILFSSMLSSFKYEVLNILIKPSYNNLQYFDNTQKIIKIEK